MLEFYCFANVKNSKGHGPIDPSSTRSNSGNWRCNSVVPVMRYFAQFAAGCHNVNGLFFDPGYAAKEVKQ